MRLPERWTSLANAFIAQAHDTPDAVALFDRTRRVSYRELAATCTRITAGLARAGVAPGDHVGVALDRSIELVAVMLAVFRIGAVLVPIDPAWPSERRVQITADARLAWTIAEVAGPRVLAVAELDRPSGDMASGDGERRDVPISSAALALYTSGSTGEPKAVILSHRALLSRLHALALALPYQPGEVACHRTPPTFIDAYAEVFGPLLHGIATCVVPHPVAIRDLVDALVDHQITRVLLVPSLLGLLLDACPALGARAPALRIVATSGEALPEALARRVLAAAPGVRLINIYGSTEVAGDATYAEISDPVPERIAIGRALAGVSVGIVDETGTRLANGELGELVVSGPVLAEGYWNRPALTAARFVTDPASGERMFRTGDLARTLADGQLVLAGRADDQVKIAGVRIELGEIERALLAHPSVRAAAAARDESNGRARLVAGIVGIAGDADLDAIRRHLASHLPAGAIPSLLARLPEIPTNGHGKIDRRAVSAAVIASAGSLIADPIDDRDELTARVAGWFAEVAGQPALAASELEAIGGDSLARLGLLVRIEREGWHLEHADLPRPLTPHNLAARLRELPRNAFHEHVDLDSYPLTDFQRVMVLESLANAGTPIWVDQVAYTITGPLDAGRFEAAWREVIAAEPALRTSIEWRDSRLRQIVHREVAVTISRIELAALELGADRMRVLAEEWTRLSLAFALDRAPLFAICLLQGPGAHSDVIFTYHHVILDGESARRVLRSVLARYAGHPASRAEPFAGFVARTARPPDQRWRALLAGYQHVDEPEPPPATKFGDFVWRLFHRLLAFRAGRAAARVRRLARRKRLRGLLASARLTPASYGGGDVASQPLSRALDRTIRAWAAAHATTPTAIWATAYALHLARERNTRDIVFGVIVSGRDGRSIDTIGMLANCLPLRIQIHDTPASDTPSDGTRSEDSGSIASLVTRVGRGLDELERMAHTPLLAMAADVGLDPRSFLDTLFISWGFPVDAQWRALGAPQIRGGRGVTLFAPRTALILSASSDGGELGIGARAFHRTDRIRRDVLALVDAILEDAPLARLLASEPHRGGMSIALPDL